jgi:small subunit ribosomal protein S2
METVAKVLLFREVPLADSKHSENDGKKTERRRKMARITIKDLLDAGVHFGHQTKRWNPKMKDYVYGAKNGISIIDLTQTMHQIADACNFLQRVVMNGGNILFVGTKRQAQQIIKETADKNQMHYVSERWLGGTLTNNVTIRKSITKMYEIDKMLESEAAASLKKKELAALSRKASKLHRDLDGIATMKKLPDAIVLVDVCHDDIAVREAVKLNIPIVALLDTNGDPDNIDYPIAANDDAVKSIKIIIDLFSDAIAVATDLYHKKVVEEKAKADAEKAEKEAKIKADREAKAEAKKAAEAEKKAAEAEKKAAPKKPVAKKADEQKEEAKTEKAEQKPADEEKAEAKPAAKKAAPKKPAAKKPAEKKEDAAEKAETVEK